MARNVNKLDTDSNFNKELKMARLYNPGIPKLPFGEITGKAGSALGGLMTINLINGILRKFVFDPLGQKEGFMAKAGQFFSGVGSPIISVLAAYYLIPKIPLEKLDKDIAQAAAYGMAGLNLAKNLIDNFAPDVEAVQTFKRMTLGDWAATKGYPSESRVGMMTSGRTERAGNPKRFRPKRTFFGNLGKKAQSIGNYQRNKGVRYA
ncbi:MAG: hypothetical protein ABII90_03660 [Bacteroidota bacterium]